MMSMIAGMRRDLTRAGTVAQHMEIEPMHPVQIQRFRETSFRDKMAIA